MNRFSAEQVAEMLDRYGLDALDTIEPEQIADADLAHFWACAQLAVAMIRSMTGAG